MRHKTELYAGLWLVGIALFLAACEARSKPMPMASEPAWSPDGQQIVYVCHEEVLIVNVNGRGGRTLDTGICVMNRDGTNRRYLVRQSRDDHQPTWSPNGKGIAFISAGRLYIVDPGGGQPRQVFEGHAETPRWSPDGRRIAFIGRHGNEPYTIHVIDKDGQQLASLENPERATLCDPHWSPDGNQIAYTSTLEKDCYISLEGNPYRIMIADARGSSPARKIADDLAPVRDLAWVNQETLSYGSSLGTEHGYTLYSIDLKSGSRTEIETKKGIFAWAPDGTALAYTDSEETVYVRDFLPDQTTLIWKGAENVWNIYYVVWSPDSQRLLIGLEEETPPDDTVGFSTHAETLWVISRDGKSAQRLTPLGPGKPVP
jgi:Tol biopolymer transport system component